MPTARRRVAAIPSLLLCILGLLIRPAALRADEVAFGEKDRVTGTLVEVSGGRAMLRSDAAGEVRVPWNAVTDVRTAAALVVQLADGRTLKGSLDGFEGGGLRVVTPEGVQAVERTQVVRIGPEPAPPAPQGPVKGTWLGSVEVGLSALAGNSKRQDYRLGTEIRYRLPTHRWHLTASAQHGRSRGKTDVSRARLGLTYSHNLWGRSYYSTGAFLDHDDMKRLRLSGYYFLSRGYRIVDAAPSTWNLEIGGTYVNDNFRYKQREDLTALVRTVASMRVLGGSTLQAIGMVWPSLGQLDHVRGNMTLSLDLPVARKMSLRFGVAEDYDSQPPAGLRPHDLQTSLTLAYRL